MNGKKRGYTDIEIIDLKDGVKIKFISCGKSAHTVELDKLTLYYLCAKIRLACERLGL